jgi:hypothetical protein
MIHLPGKAGAERGVYSGAHMYATSTVRVLPHKGRKPAGLGGASARAGSASAQSVTWWLPYATRVHGQAMVSRLGVIVSVVAVFLFVVAVVVLLLDGHFFVVLSILAGSEAGQFLNLVHQFLAC